MLCRVRRSGESRSTGPFRFDEVMRWIREGMLGPADDLSMDEGRTWTPVAALGDARTLFGESTHAGEAWPALTHSTPHRRRRVLDLAPMIDVLFLLLIFFLVTARLESDAAEGEQAATRDIEVSAPVVDEEADAPKESAGQPVEVILQSDGALLYQGSEVSVLELAHEIRSLTDEGRKALEVVVYGDQFVSYGLMAQVVARLDNIPGTTVMLGMISEGGAHD